MKAKDLAEQLLKYPDFEVEFDVDTETTFFKDAYPYFVTYKIIGIDEIAHSSKVIILGGKEVEL